MEKEGDHYTRVLQVLEQLAATQYPQTLAQLAQRTGLPKTTLMRMLQSLEKSAYVTHLPGGQGYVTGPHANQLGIHLLQAPHILRACRSTLGKLIAITGEACNLTAAAGDSVHYLARVESPDVMRLQLHMEIGAHVPMHCTASGKLFLALAHKTHQLQMLSRLTLTSLTPKTITSQEALVAALQQIRTREIGVDDEEFIRGMVAVAVPVKNTSGDVIAAVACHAPTAQKSLNQLLAYAEPMQAAANEITHMLSVQHS